MDDSGKIIGYKTSKGGDTVFELDFGSGGGSSSAKKTIINLGRSSTYSVATYDGYQNFTIEDNFLIGTYESSMSASFQYENSQTPSGYGTIKQSVSYDNSTGILSVAVNGNTWKEGLNSGYISRLSVNINGNLPNVWLIY